MGLQDFAYKVFQPSAEATLFEVQACLVHDQPGKALEAIQRYYGALYAQGEVDKAIRAFIEAVKNS